MVYTYLIQSLKDKSFYCGITNDFNKRLFVHNRGGLKITSGKRPWQLVYFKEHYNYESARKHEKWLKKKNTKYKNWLAHLAPPNLSHLK